MVELLNKISNLKIEQLKQAIDDVFNDKNVDFVLFHLLLNELEKRIPEKDFIKFCDLY